MKHTSKHNAGFTLIELVVAIAMATIVTAAATSVLLMGLRINRQTADTASQQITVRSLLNVMENAAADGSIAKVEADFIDETTQETQYGSWRLKGEDETVIFQYNAKEQTIYTNGIPVLEGVIASNAIMEGQLLSISVETKTGIYTSSIYCRTAEFKGEQGAPSIGVDDGTARGKFIEILKSQYRSRGTIKEKIKTGLDSNNDPIYEYRDTGKYYSEWYVGSYETNPGWNEKTPWCACFVSWALYTLEEPEETTYLVSVPKHSHVDKFMESFDSEHWIQSKFLGGTTEPQAGDLIFFDWNADSKAQHIGVVLEVKNNMVYTIEGNSAGRVAIRSYSLSDPRIIGYGILSWT